MAPPNLRELPQSERHFWQHSITDQLSLKVFDQNADYFRRVLPENEVAVLALNEIAAERRRGYFLHLPSRSAWASLSDEDRTPAERSPLLPGPEYPTIMCMPLAWSDQTYTGFTADTHRARYLRSSALVSASALLDCPLYPIQYAIRRCPVFATSSESQVIFATPSGYYVSSTSELEEILGLEKKGSKLASANWLWDEKSLDKGRDDRRSKFAAMGVYHVASLEAVYDELMRRCSANNPNAVALTSQELQALIPRPSSQAADVGRQLGARVFAPLRSRKGARPFAPRGKKRRRLLEEAGASEMHQRSDTPPSNDEEQGDSSDYV